MDARVGRFRKAVGRLGLGRAGGRYPSELRALAVEIAQARESEPMAAIARELGVRPLTLARWLGAGKASSEGQVEPGFYPIELDRGDFAESEGWVVVTPGGVRVEGRATEALLAVLRELS